MLAPSFIAGTDYVRLVIMMYTTTQTRDEREAVNKSRYGIDLCEELRITSVLEKRLPRHSSIT